MGLPSVAVGAGGREQGQQACLVLPICALVAGRKPLFKARTGPKREAYAGIWPGALYEFLAEDSQVSSRRELWSVIGAGPAWMSTLKFRSAVAVPPHPGTPRHPLEPQNSSCTVDTVTEVKAPH